MSTVPFQRPTHQDDGIATEIARAKKKLRHLTINGQPIKVMAAPLIGRASEPLAPIVLEAARRVSERVMYATLLSQGGPSALK